MSAQEYSFLVKLKREWRPFWNGKKKDLSYELSLTCGDNVNYYKSFHHAIHTCENREHPGNFQNKSLSSAFSCVQVYSLLGQTEGCKKRSLIVRLPPKSTWLS